MTNSHSALDVLNKQINDASEGLSAAFAKFGVTLEQAANNITSHLNNLPPEFYHLYDMLHPRERIEKHYRDVADPAEVVQYILQQPKHTWMGVTIMPDEAWRYEQKSDWMWWR